jgi:protoporphyrinogen oxidase
MSNVTAKQRPIVILGGGPAGLGAAWQLARRGFRVTVVERGSALGGNAGSFLLDGQAVDFGSHRLHPSCAPEILSDIRSMLGGDLLDRPRHGRIHLCERWLHFPLKPADILLNAPRPFAAGVLRDIVWKPASPDEPDNFATVLRRGLGETICRDFYFPYAQKIWGLDPRQLDAEQARRRVSAGSIAKLARKVLAPSQKGRFFYPRGGFGQISDAYARAARAAGATILLDTTVERLELSGDGGAVVEAGGGVNQSLEPALVLSTIPLPHLAGMMQPAAPAAVREASASLRYRAMLLIYLTLDVDQFTEYDAHYFPSAGIAITRLSEPRNYGLAGAPGRTVLCAELPCDPSDSIWQATDGELAQVVLRALERAGIPFHGRVLGVAAKRLAQAYPVYARGFQEHFQVLDRWADSLDGVVTLGRQGLFAHDNTHHTLAMAYAAASCVDEQGRFQRERWREHRRAFGEFIVED